MEPLGSSQSRSHQLGNQTAGTGFGSPLAAEQLRVKVRVTKALNLLLEAAGSRHSRGAGSGFTEPLPGLGWEGP